jgi:hypothetical protein
VNLANILIRSTSFLIQWYWLWALAVVWVSRMWKDPPGWWI